MFEKIKRDKSHSCKATTCVGKIGKKRGFCTNLGGVAGVCLRSAVCGAMVRGVVWQWCSKSMPVWHNSAVCFGWHCGKVCWIVCFCINFWLITFLCYNHCYENDKHATFFVVWLKREARGDSLLLHSSGGTQAVGRDDNAGFGTSRACGGRL